MVHISPITNFSSVTCAHGYGNNTQLLLKTSADFLTDKSGPAHYPIKYMATFYIRQTRTTRSA